MPCQSGRPTPPPNALYCQTQPAFAAARFAAGQRAPQSSTPTARTAADDVPAAIPKCPWPDLPPCAPASTIRIASFPSPCPPPRPRHRAAALEPFRKLERQQLAKQAPHTHAGVVIAAAPDNVLFSFVISTIWTIERQRHEAREGNGASVPYLSRNSFGRLRSIVWRWCGFSYQSHRLYGILWRRSMLSLI